MREAKDQVAAGDLRNKLTAKRLAAAKPQQAAGEHDGGEIGFERQRAADRLHDNHGLHRTAG